MACDVGDYRKYVRLPRDSGTDIRNESTFALFNIGLPLSSSCLGWVSFRSPVTIRDTEDVVPIMTKIY